MFACLYAAEGSRPDVLLGVARDFSPRVEAYGPREVLLDPRSTARGYFHAEVVDRILEEHVSCGRSWHHQIWNLLMLELWHREMVDGVSLGRAEVTV